MSNARNLANLLGTGTQVTTADIADGVFQANKNLIINGAMQVAQRGTSSSNSGIQTVDRFNGAAGSWSGWAFTQEQSSDTPVGFSNSLKLTTTTVETSFDASDLFYMNQEIEAQNLQQLKYGTSSAETCTLSFWVKSSIAGVFGISLYQYDNGPYILTPTYTINTANTWEYKTVTIAGNTSGSIDNDNSNGMRVSFIVAAGSDYNDGTSRTSWESYAADKFASGHVQNGVITTLNATFQITGVQLEVGDTATPFEHRSYGDELARCQRYYYKANIGAYMFFSPYMNNTGAATAGTLTIQYPVPMRATPSVVQESFGNISGTPSEYNSTDMIVYAGNALNTSAGHISAFNADAEL